MPPAAPETGTAIEGSVSAEPPNAPRSSFRTRCFESKFEAIRFADSSSAAWRWP
jgi:hypothetical protein